MGRKGDQSQTSVNKGEGGSRFWSFCDKVIIECSHSNMKEWIADLKTLFSFSESYNRAGVVAFNIFQGNTAQKIKFSIKDFFSKCDQHLMLFKRTTQMFNTDDNDDLKVLYLKGSI